MPEKIVENSVTIKENICLSSFHTGGAISRQLSIRLIDNWYDPRYSDIVIAQKYTLQNNTVVTFPMGTFVVDAESIKKRREFTDLNAYDYFVKADDIISEQEANDFTGTTLWDVFSYTANLCGLTLGFVESDISGYHNFAAKPFWKDGTVAPFDLQKALTMGATYRDILSSAAALIGCGLKIDRATNQVKLVKFTTPRTSVYTINENNAIKRDINDKYSMIRFASYGTNKKMQIAAILGDYYAADLSLGTNVLLPDESNYGTAYIIQYAAESMTGLQSIELYESNITWFGYPGLEAGDYITSEQSWLDADEIGIYVMENIWKPHSPCTIRSFGSVSSNVYATGGVSSYGESRRASRANVTTSQEATALQNQIITNTTYSSGEHTVGAWLDGGKLYEKTYTFLALGDSSTRQVSQALGITRLKEIVESRGQVIGSGYSMPIPTVPIGSDGQSVDAEDGVSFLADTANAQLIVRNGATDRSGEKAYITLRYTKLPSVWYGYALTQNAYDAITAKDSSKYYCIISGMSATEEIYAVEELSAAQYAALTEYGANTLYLIKSGSTIEDVYYGSTQASKLYLGTTVLWTLDPTPSWIPSDWAQRMPALPASYASYCVIAIKYGNTICVFKIQARDLSSINKLYMSNPYFSIDRPLFDGYAAWAGLEYSLDGTYRRTNGVYSYEQYAGTTLANASNYGGMPTVNAVCLEHQGDIVWYDNNTGIGLDYI